VRIAVIQREDTRSLTVHSGVYYFMVQALKRHVGEVIHLDPDQSLTSRGIENAGRCLNHLGFSRWRRFSSDHNKVLARRLAKVFASRLRQIECDVVFAPNASVEIADLETSLPIIYRTDLNWANIVNYYPGCKSLFDFVYREGERIESAAIRKASAILYPSEWAARTAIEHYGAAPERVFSIPNGANLHPEEAPQRDQALRHRLSDSLRLLWVGADWSRKGGDIAYDCMIQLRHRGIDARLTICGCTPPAGMRHSAITFVRFLRKSIPIERQQLSQLYLNSHLFIFPTQAEAFGTVLCEASAHGLPVLAADTGGVGGAIRDGENGYLLPVSATGSDYASKAQEIIRSSDAYERLVQGSRDAYESRLNWDAWAKSVRPVFEAVMCGSNSLSSSLRLPNALSSRFAAYNETDI